MYHPPHSDKGVTVPAHPYQPSREVSAMDDWRDVTTTYAYHLKRVTRRVTDPATKREAAVHSTVYHMGTGIVTFYGVNGDKRASDFIDGFMMARQLPNS